MSRFDDLLDRVTDRLKVDPELRAEVRHELESHLEDSANEFRAAGMNEEDAASKAVESFGDESQVAQQLWDANRKKIPARKAFRAFGRFALAPAVAVVSVAAGWTALTSLAVVLMVASSMTTTSWSGIQPLRSLADLLRFRMTWQLAPDDRLAFLGNRDAQTEELRAKPIVERWPNDKMFFAEYAARALMSANISRGPEKTDRAELARVLAIMDRGEQLEPDNGLYPLLKAALLVDVSSEINELDDNDPKQLSFEFADPRDPTKKLRRFYEVKIVDPATFERAVGEMRKAASKPFIESYAIPLTDRRLAMLRAPKTLGEQLMREMFSIEVLLPTLNHSRQTTEGVLGYALMKAQAGDGDTALALTRDARRIAAMSGATSHVLVELLVSWGMYTSADAHEAMIFKLLGRNDDFERARERLRENSLASFKARTSPVEENKIIKQHAGLAESSLNNAVFKWKESDVRPGRVAEYAVADQIALALFVLALTVPLALRWLVGQLQHWRGEPKPISVFVGWGRLGKILLLGVIAPVIGYAIYVRLFHAREYGIGMTFGRMLVEYSALACVMTILLRIFSDRAMQARARELGLPAPAAFQPSRGMIVIGCGLGLLVVGYLIRWERAAAAIKEVQPVLVGMATLLAGLVLFYALAWTRQQAPKRESEQNRSWLTRRLPDWVLVALLIASVVALRWAIIETNRGGGIPKWLIPLPLICIGIVFGIGCVLIWNYIKKLSAPVGATRMRFRSVIPIPAAAALVLLLTVGLGARVAEKRIITKNDRGSRTLREIDRSTLAPLQQQLRAELMTTSTRP